MTDSEQDVRRTFIEVRRQATLAKKDPKELHKLSKARQKLVRLLLDQGAAELLKHMLERAGKFYSTAEGDLFFFRNADHRLYDIEEKTFERYLVQLTDNVTGLRQQWLPRLQAWVRFNAPEVTTHFLAYNDGPDLGVIAVNCFDGRMMRRKRNGSWESVLNGTDGVLFRTPPDFLTSWQAEIKNVGSGKDLDWLCSLAHFEDGRLSIEDQRRLLRTWILHLFLTAINPVHPIPLHEGVTGSGKSFLGEAIGRWLTGPEFEVMDLPSGDSAKAEESIKLALCKRPLGVIDNVDSPAPWLEDFLCRYATGVRMSRRRLYTNAEEVYFYPRAGLIVTSRDPHFRREDVARRLLPLHFRSIPEGERRSETVLRAELDARRAGIWGDVLAELACFQDAWPTLKATIKPNHSLADFSVFGEALAASQSHEAGAQQWRTIMKRLEADQHQFATEEDPLVDLLREALPASGTLAQCPVKDLYKTLWETSISLSVPWPYKNGAALTKALKHKRVALERALGVRIVLTNNHQGGQYEVAITKASGTPDSKSGQGGDSGHGSSSPLSGSGANS